MAKVMPFTDLSGNVYQSSYWRVSQITIGVIDRGCSIIVHGYKDAEARNSGKTPIGTKVYTVTGDQFDALMNNDIVKGVKALAYTGIINTINDVPDPNNPGQYVNFFAGATDLI